MTAKQILKKIESLKARQMKLRDEMRDLFQEAEEHLGNADDACLALEDAADCVSRLL